MHKTDTAEDVQKVYDGLIQSLTEEERFLRGISLTHFCRQICWKSIKNDFPHLTPDDRAYLFFERVYGQNFSTEEKENFKRTIVNLKEIYEKK